MKNLKNLGKALNKQQQKAINGGFGSNTPCEIPPFACTACSGSSFTFQDGISRCLGTNFTFSCLDAFFGIRCQ